MISLSKIVDNEKINIKLDLNALRAKLPSVEKNICITLVATKSPRKADNWKKNDKEYYNVILNHNRVLYSTSQFVSKMILKECLAVLDNR